LCILFFFSSYILSSLSFFSSKIQETIEETIRKQSEAVGKKRSKEKETANPSARRYRRNMRRRGRGKAITSDIVSSGSDDEDREEENAKDATIDLSSADDHSPDLRHNRGRKRSVSQPSPARTVGSTDHGFEENNELVGGKEILATSPLQGEMLAWGKNGTRSQTRHGSAAGSNGRMIKGGRIPKLVDHLRTTDEMDKEVI
jgi:E3 ubiquitin-protein ligase RNF1/2